MNKIMRKNMIMKKNIKKSMRKIIMAPTDTKLIPIHLVITQVSEVTTSIKDTLPNL
jgi:hypothetical protein